MTKIYCWVFWHRTPSLFNFFRMISNWFDLSSLLYRSRSLHVTCHRTWYSVTWLSSFKYLIGRSCIHKIELERRHRLWHELCPKDVVEWNCFYCGCWCHFLFAVVVLGNIKCCKREQLEVLEKQKTIVVIIIIIKCNYIEWQTFSLFQHIFIHLTRWLPTLTTRKIIVRHVVALYPIVA